MKVDTPVATMGIRGTAVLVEIDFDVPARAARRRRNSRSWSSRTAPRAHTFCSTRSRLRRSRRSIRPARKPSSMPGHRHLPASAPLSPDAQKLITDVFTLKFTDHQSRKPSSDHFTDTIIPKQPSSSWRRDDFVAVTLSVRQRRRKIRRASPAGPHQPRSHSRAAAGCRVRRRP